MSDPTLEQMKRDARERERREQVNHPEHYGGADNPYEHVKVAEAWGLDQDAFLYNATKYLCRAGKKGNRIEDLRKAIWYILRAIHREVKLKRDQGIKLEATCEELDCDPARGCHSPYCLHYERGHRV